MNEFQFHPVAIVKLIFADRNHVPPSPCVPGPRVHRRTHLRRGAGGARALSEPDQFVGEDFLVTVHGPLNPKVPRGGAARDAGGGGPDSGRPHPAFHLDLPTPSSPRIARRESEMVAEIAREVGLLEQRVMAGEDEDPQEFLSQLFSARHGLLTIKTMAEQGSEIPSAAIKLTRFAPPNGLELMKDVLDQYETVAHISDSQLRFLIGVTEFYRARTDTRVTIAAERLAVIAALTLPITSLSSIVG